VDTKHEITTVEYIGPHRQTVVHPHRAEFPIEMIPVYAMFREAKNANSEFYRFLCYYKILEGLLKKMKIDVIEMAKSSGVVLKHQKLIVPNHPEIHNKFHRYIGRSVNTFFDKVLTNEFRNAVAHFVLDNGSILNMSDPEHTDAYAALMLICELCVRRAIANHELLLNQIHFR
jgi:hypothetical protein